MITKICTSSSVSSHYEFVSKIILTKLTSNIIKVIDVDVIPLDQTCRDVLVTSFSQCATLIWLTCNRKYILKLAKPGLFFVYFRLFYMSQFRYNLIKAWILCLGFETWGNRMEGANKSTELRRKIILLVDIEN